MLLKDQTAIVGIGQTEFAKDHDATELELACRAVLAALDDAGISPTEVDALSSYTMEQTTEFELARSLGFADLRYFGQVGYGGGAACGALGQLSMAVGTGIANVGVLWRARKRGAKTSRVWAGVEARIDDHWKWSRPSGLLRPVDEIAVLMRRYMHEFGATRDHLANVALAFRAHANANPNALMYERKLERDEYMDARMIADPLCLFDNCLESDGAVAVVVARSDRARDCARAPAFVHAWSQGLARQAQNMTNFHSDDPLRTSSTPAAQNLWRQADFGPDDVDVAQFYDAFSPLVFFSLEAYGFCPRGEGAAFTEGGALEVGSRLPTNTSGGGMSECYIHGMNLLTEGVRQIRGTSTAQVSDAETCLVTSCDSTPTGAVLLRR